MGAGDQYAAALNARVNRRAQAFQEQLAQQEFALRIKQMQYEQQRQSVADARAEEAYQYGKSLRPLDEAISQLKLQQEQMQTGMSERAFKDQRWQRGQQAALLNQFPALAAAQQYAPLLESQARITSLNAEADHYKAQAKQMADESAQAQQAIDFLSKRRDQQKSSLYDLRSTLDGTLSAIEEQNPGFTLTAKERQGLYDLSEKAVGNGLAVEQVPGLLTNYLSTIPRFQDRIGFAEQAAAEPGFNDGPTPDEMSALDAPMKARAAAKLQADWDAEINRLLHAPYTAPNRLLVPHPFGK